MGRRPQQQEKITQFTPVKLYTGLFLIMGPFIFGSYMVEHPISILIPAVLFGVPQTRNLFIDIWDAAMQDDRLSWRGQRSPPRAPPSPPPPPPPPPPPQQNTTVNIPQQSYRAVNEDDWGNN